jgi:hypothetical protein
MILMILMICFILIDFRLFICFLKTFYILPKIHNDSNKKVLNRQIFFSVLLFSEYVTENFSLPFFGPVIFSPFAMECRSHDMGHCLFDNELVRRQHWVILIMIILTILTKIILTMISPSSLMLTHTLTHTARSPTHVHTHLLAHLHTK